MLLFFEGPFGGEDCVGVSGHVFLGLFFFFALFIGEFFPLFFVAVFGGFFGMGKGFGGLLFGKFWGKKFRDRKIWDILKNWLILFKKT